MHDFVNASLKVIWKNGIIQEAFKAQQKFLEAFIEWWSRWSNEIAKYCVRWNPLPLATTVSTITSRVWGQMLSSWFIIWHKELTILMLVALQSSQCVFLSRESAAMLRIRHSSGTARRQYPWILCCLNLQACRKLAWYMLLDMCCNARTRVATVMFDRNWIILQYDCCCFGTLLNWYLELANCYNEKLLWSQWERGMPGYTWYTQRTHSSHQFWMRPSYWWNWQSQFDVPVSIEKSHNLQLSHDEILRSFCKFIYIFQKDRSNCNRKIPWNVRLESSLQVTDRTSLPSLPMISWALDIEVKCSGGQVHTSTSPS